MSISNKLHICFVGLGNLPVLAPEYEHHGIGGEQVQQTLLGRALHRRGYQVSMIVADHGQQDGKIWQGIATYKAYKPDEGIPLIRFLHPRWTKLWRAMRQVNADVYYVSCAGALVGQVAMFCKMHGKRLVFRIASDSDCEPDKLLVQYARDKRLYAYGLQKADAILAQTQFQRERMLKNYGHDSQVAGMLVETPAEDKDYSQRDIDVLWVSNLRQIKRPDLVLDVAEQMPDVNFHIVGGREPSSPSLYEEVEARAARLPNVTFHGRVPYREVGRLYDRSKLFLNTSDMEGFPNSYLQAWIRGTPVIAFFDPDGVISREGLGSSVASLEDMKSMIHKCLINSDLLLERGQACREFMRKEFNDDLILAPYIQAFHCTKRSGSDFRLRAAKVSTKQ